MTTHARMERVFSTRILEDIKNTAQRKEASRTKFKAFIMKNERGTPEQKKEAVKVALAHYDRYRKEWLDKQPKKPSKVKKVVEAVKGAIKRLSKKKSKKPVSTGEFAVANPIFAREAGN